MALRAGISRFSRNIGDFCRGSFPGGGSGAGTIMNQTTGRLSLRRASRILESI